MGIDVAWVDECHEVKQIVGDSHQVLTRLATTRWPKLSSSICLRFVVPWGDAVFNQAQMPELISELRSETVAAQEPKVRAHLEKLIALTELAVRDVHQYIKFIGD